MTEGIYLRKIQSFVRRSGRLSKAQSLGLNELWGDYGVNIDNKILNFDELFFTKNNILLRSGLGMGTAY